MQPALPSSSALAGASPALTSQQPWARLWPLPALLTWALAWGLFAMLRTTTAPLWVAAAIGGASGLALAVWGDTRTRRLLLALGFPVSLAASGLAVSLPGWAWLLPLGLLLLAYPLGAWRDAPLFPTPRAALDGLADLAPLARDASVLDAGCGLGDGLVALRRAYPGAILNGIERSAPIAGLAALRGRLTPLRARIARGDMWAADWRPHALVYLFQRPESLPRAVVKARAELSPGAWLASLEFEATELLPQARLTCPDGRPVWLYRAPFVTARPGMPRTPAHSSRRWRR